MTKDGPGSVKVSFFGGELIPHLPKSLELDLSGPVTAAELVTRLEQATGTADLRAKMERYYAILVDGTSIQHLQGWSTQVRPGASVAVVAPMGGGLTELL